MIGNSGSKYDFPDANLDQDIENRQKVIESFAGRIEAVLMDDVRYADGLPMSTEQRFLILLDVARKYSEKVNG